MELNEEEKRQLFQVDGDCQAKVLDELYSWCPRPCTAAASPAPGGRRYSPPSNSRTGWTPAPCAPAVPAQAVRKRKSAPP